MAGDKDHKKHIEGFGTIYLRSSTWWIRYWARGKEYRESAHTSSEKQAVRYLKERIRASGRPGFDPSEERLDFEDLTNMIRADYRLNEHRSLKKLNNSIRHLAETFSGERAVNITADKAKIYADHRKETGAANATINRELAALRRMFNLAIANGRLSAGPKIVSLDENNARTGFLDHAEFQRLIEAVR
jgi:hypothetical protein